MPGNDVDGGFASHIRVPSRWLVKIPDNYQGDIARLSVVADAISTPWQALLRAGVEEGDTCIIVGCGGIGGYCAQLALSMKANVICIDNDQRRLESMRKLGFSNLLNCNEKTTKEVKNYLRELITSNGWGCNGWKIFECSGNADGQTLAFELIGPSGVLAIVGFTMSKVNIRLSNLMAHDARVFGNWGCQPELYPELLEMVVSGAVDLKNSSQLLPLSEICEVFENAHNGAYVQRVILIPDNIPN
jgi:6-hydroxycyclohex-1-ene-1-carbonyl-CoA dehydrogenase